MFIICIVDFKNRVISNGITNDSQFRDIIIRYAKTELETLKQIDNVIKELLRSEDFDFQKYLGIYAIQFLEKMDCFNIKYHEQSFLINKENIEKLIQGYRLMYVTECTIFVPVLTSPKWIKGLIKEKNFELQILAPGFTLENERFHLEIIEFDSNLREILEEIAAGRLIILYIPYSQLAE